MLGSDHRDLYCSEPQPMVEVLTVSFPNEEGRDLGSNGPCKIAR